MAEIFLYVDAALADEAAGPDAHAAALPKLCDTLATLCDTLADEAAEPDAHAMALATLCDTLVAFSGLDILAVFDPHRTAFFTRLPALVAAGAGEDQGDVLPLFAARAIAEACEVEPRWAASFAMGGAVEALRDRLLAINSMELADECLRALHLISEECPGKCLHRGVAAAVLRFFDFFSATKQKLALKIVATIVTGCREGGASATKAMEAAPALCNLLHSADKTILESALSCLATIVAASVAGGNAEHMDRVCKSDAVEVAMKLMDNDGWKGLSHETLSDILALLIDLSYVSEKVVKSLFELGVCDLLKQMISYYSCSHSDSAKLQMLLELICQLMRPLETSDHSTGIYPAKKNVIIEPNEYIDQLASIVTLIVQVAKCGALSSVCYSCIVVIGNIVELSTPTFLIELQKTANLSSLLTCLLARKNCHVVFQTLKVSKALLKKHHQFFFETFSREGVKHAINAIQAREKDRNSSNHKLQRKNNFREICFCFDSEASSVDEECRIGNNAILNLAEEILNKSFLVVKGTSKAPSRLGCVLKSIRESFSRLNGHAMKELSDISRRLLSLPSTSTFEFVETGSTKHLAGYLSNGAYFNANLKTCQDFVEQLKEVQSRLQKFTHLALRVSNGSSTKPLEFLVEKLLDALHMSYDSFPVILAGREQCTRESTMIPLRHSGTKESASLDVKFVRSRREKELHNYGGVLSVDLSSKPDDIEEVLLPEICESASKVSNITAVDYPGDGQGSSRLTFSYKGTELEPSATFFESLVRLTTKTQSDIHIDPSFWDEVHKISYKRRKRSTKISSPSSYNTQLPAMHGKLEQSWRTDPFFSTIFLGKLPGDLDESDPSYNFLFLLKVLEGINRLSYQLSMEEQICKFSEGCLRDLDDVKVTICPIPQHQFVSSLLTNKLEQQMQDSLFEYGLIPSWCVYLVETCPFLLSFDARWKYFCLTVHRSFMAHKASTPPDEAPPSPDQARNAPKTEKYKLIRGNILEGAASMMIEHGSSTRTIEVEFEGEVGTGRGPTIEFYTIISHELQRIGTGMWRGDNARKVEGETGFVPATFGLFPQPWSSVGTSSRGIKFSDVVQKFKLLGHLLARAVLDGRILDIPLSKAFYKIMLEQELDIYDIPSFDPELGKTLLEFQALVKRNKFLETSAGRISDQSADLSYKNVILEDLCLDFTLPGNPEYELLPGGSEKMVTLDSLEEYVSLVVDATLKSGIDKQIEAFMSGINEVFSPTTLRMFTEEEMERILCGEQDSWASKKLEDHIEFEHGYEANSPSVINFLEILREFDREEQRAFIQFTTGAPQLPLGGLASLDPKLTLVAKQCDGNVDNELPSVNTCRHFIKLPPYSSKEIMRKKLKYAITEGLGSFHLS